MKNLINNLILKALPLWIIAWSGYKAYENYLKHSTETVELRAKVEDIQSLIKNTVLKNKRAIEFKKDLENSKAKVISVTSQIENVQRQLPNTIADTEIIDTIAKEAEAIRIRNISINPATEKELDFYFSKKYEVKADGTFLQFLVFFERLGTQDRIFNVVSLNMVNSPTVSKGRFKQLKIEAEIEAFRYNSSGAKNINNSESNTSADENKTTNKLEVLRKKIQGGD